MTAAIIRNRILFTGVFVLAGASGLTLGLVGRATADDAARSTRYFEMRTYTTNEGKFDALLARFRDHTTKLFEKHGMTNIAYWAPVAKDGEQNTLVYVLAYPDADAREASWKAFMSDPEWQKVYRESTVDGKLVQKVESVFMHATDFSPIQ